MSEAATAGDRAALDKIEKLSGAVRRYRIDAEASAKRAEDLEKKVVALTAERDDLAKKADPAASAQRIEALTAQLRGLKHRQAFDRAALEAGADPKRLEAIWKLAEVQADADEPDAAKIAEAVKAQKEANDWAFTPEPPPPPDPNAPPPPKPAKGSGQGGNAGAPSQFSEEQLNDPKFVMQNFERISLAAQDRITRGEI